MIQAGDILFYHGGNGPGDRLIRQLTGLKGYRYAHCEVAISATESIGAEHYGVVRHMFPPPTAVAHTRAWCNPLWIKHALEWTQHQIGDRYGWGDIVADTLQLFLPRPTPLLVLPSQYDCSHLAATFLLIAGYRLPDVAMLRPQTVSPSSLASITHAVPVTPQEASMPAQQGPQTLGTSTTLTHVHETMEGIETIDLTPPHPPRTDTPEYARAHHFLIYEKKASCEVCGVTITTVKAPDMMETHHWPIERSFAAACDPAKVHADFPSVYDMTTLMQFVDSPGNLKVLCSTHHRSKQHGIHHLLVADYAIQRYLRDGYLIATDAASLAVALATDERIEQASGIEASVAPGLGTSVAGTPSVIAPTSPPVATRPKRTRARPATKAAKSLTSS